MSNFAIDSRSKSTSVQLNAPTKTGFFPRRLTLSLVVLLMVVLSAAACSPASSPTATPEATAEATIEGTTLTVMTHDSFNYSESVMAEFEAETGITVEVLRSGDAGAMVNQAVLSRENPLADVMFGIDNTFLSRGLNNDLFVTYESPGLANVAAEFVLDEENRVTPIDYGDVCLNYDIGYFEQQNLAAPQSLQALTEPEYRGLLVVENPATSSPGLAFLLATIAQFGTEGDYTYLDFWRDLVANNVLVVDDWETAYYGFFSLYAEQEARPLVVSYASSPPAEVYFAEPPVENAPSAAIVADGMCFRQIEFAGILQGTDNLPGAQRFIDFLLSTTFQEDMPLNMFVYPVNANAVLPDVFVQFSAVAQNPLAVSSADIDANREAWIQAWTEVVLR